MTKTYDFNWIQDCHYKKLTIENNYNKNGESKNGEIFLQNFEYWLLKVKKIRIVANSNQVGIQYENQYMITNENCG
jgi:hypothetical protein